MNVCIREGVYYSY